MLKVIVPTSKTHEPLLTRSLGSIVNQTMDDFCVVVVGDGFLPDCDICDDRFRFERSAMEPEGMWGTSPRNFGLLCGEESSHVCYLDADNEWLPHHLEVMSKAMLEFDIFCSAFYAVDSVGTAIEIDRSSTDLGRIDSSGMCINLSTMLDHGIVWEPRYDHDHFLFQHLSEFGKSGVGTDPTYIYHCTSQPMRNFLKR